MSNLITAPVITCARHRMQRDGKGVTTLVCFHGCTLRCKYCLNPFTLSSDTKHQNLSPEELYDRVKQDDLYFIATGGGVTFGGGEPLLYPEFIRRFRDLCGDRWHLCAETALNVPWENVSKAAQCIDVFYIDCKDTDPDIYQRYTGMDNARMLENLEKLTRMISPERIVVRVPLIPGYNTSMDQKRSVERLKAIGIVNFDLFEYITDRS